MEDVKVYPTALAANGWAFKEKCMCSGVRKFKFANPNYPGIIVEWWVKYFKFRVTDKNVVSQPLTKLSDLDSYLKTYAATHPKAKAPTIQALKVPVETKTEAEPVQDQETKTEDTTTEDKKLTNDDSKVSEKSAPKPVAKNKAAKRDQLN